MPEETITFELIRKIQLEEQKSPTLTRLPINFMLAVSSYLQQKRNVTANDDRKGALEMRSVERLVEDIFNRRERKILNAGIIAARSGLPPENLSEEEKPFYSSVVALIRNRRKELFMAPADYKPADVLVIFKDDTPEFVGMDEQTYGPFKKGDVAKIPEENRKILLERGIVEEAK